MRQVWTSILTVAFSLVPTASFTAPPQAPQQDVPPPPATRRAQVQEVGRMNAGDGDVFVGFFFPHLRPPSPDWYKEIAGLPSSGHPELLTWERVYTLALVRARSASAKDKWNASALDPKVLADRAGQYGIADFARFRNDFLAASSGEEGSFHDPSAGYLELLCRLQKISNASYDVGQRENCLKLYQELIRGEASGLSNLDVDSVDASVAAARQQLADEIAQYRNALDKFKTTIGLSPEVPLIPDQEAITPFRDSRERAHNWHRSPNRTLNLLPKFIAHVPALGDVTLDGQPILETIDSHPDRQEELLVTATRLARNNLAARQKEKSTADADAQLALRTRRRVRDLLETRRSYVAEQRRFELATRLMDQVLTQFAAPPGGGTQALAQSLGARVHSHLLLEQLDEIHRVQNRLVTLWSSFKADRLALYRELGILPYNDWKSFYDDLAAH